jgi:putative hydrolase of the HAD superfamily
MFRGLIFDLDNTLIDRNAAFKAFVLDLLLEFDVSNAAAIAIEVEKFANWGYCPFDEVFHYLQGLAAVPLTPEQFLALQFKRVPTYVGYDKKVFNTLTDCNGYTLAILTNGSGRTQRAKLQNSRLNEKFPEGHIFISGEIGVNKPDEQAFHKVLHELHLKPSECLMIGDNPEHDIQGAMGVGISTCWISGNRPYPQEIISPTSTITTVHDLPELVKNA